MINNLLEETVESEDGEDHENSEVPLSIAEKSIGTDPIVTVDKEVGTCIYKQDPLEPSVLPPHSSLTQS